MSQQILNDLRIVPVLPQQRGIGVAKCVPAFQGNAHLCSDRLDVELHNLGHPVRCVGRFLPPLIGKRLFRSFDFHGSGYGRVWVCSFLDLKDEI